MQGGLHRDIHREVNDILINIAAFHLDIRWNFLHSRIVDFTSSFFAHLRTRVPCHESHFFLLMNANHFHWKNFASVIDKFIDIDFFYNFLTSRNKWREDTPTVFILL